jgi:hypothetical protein
MNGPFEEVSAGPTEEGVGDADVDEAFVTDAAEEGVVAASASLSAPRPT